MAGFFYWLFFITIHLKHRKIYLALPANLSANYLLLAIVCLSLLCYNFFVLN